MWVNEWSLEFGANLTDNFPREGCWLQAVPSRWFVLLRALPNSIRRRADQCAHSFASWPPLETRGELGKASGFTNTRLAEHLSLPASAPNLLAPSHLWHSSLKSAQTGRVKKYSTRRWVQEWKWKQKSPGSNCGQVWRLKANIYIMRGGN